MTIEIIKRNGEDYVVIPYDSYEKLREDAEMLSDIQAYDLAKQDCQETFPAEVVYAIALHGENPVKVYREYRQLSLAELAHNIDLSPESLQAIEQNINFATDEDLKAIADTLQVDIDMIKN